MSDVLFVLRHGFVLEQSDEESTVPGLHKYAIGSLAPNSERRLIRIIVVPGSEGKPHEDHHGHVGGQLMKGAEMSDYHYTECGLNNVFIEGALKSGRCR